MENFVYYIFAITVLCVVFLLIKNITSCLIKSIVLILVAIILGIIYFKYSKQDKIEQKNNIKVELIKIHSNTNTCYI